MLDASAAGRLLIDGSQEVEHALREYRVVAPAFMLLELANALAVGVRFGGLAPERAARALEELLQLPIDFAPDEAVAGDALAIALELPLSAYDAAYVALAGARAAVLLTADRRLAAIYERSRLIA